MVRKMRFLALIISLSLLFGCTSIGRLLGSETAQQREARRIQSLEVPPQLSPSTSSDLMVIPGGHGGVASLSAVKERAAKTTETFAGNAFAQIIKAGDRQWLKIDANTQRTYDMLLQFLLKNDIPIISQDPSLGLIETDWIDNVLAAPKRFLGIMIGSQLRDRFRIRIDYADEADKTEVFFTHYAVQKVLVEEAKTGNILVERSIVGDGDRHKVGDWQVMPSQKEAEIEMLRRFVAFIDIGQTDIEALSNAAVVKPENSKLVEDEAAATVALEIYDRFFNAWRLTGLAIDRASFTIVDQDRAQGIYFVRFDPTVDNPKSRGFWSSLAFWRKDDDIKAGVYQFIVKDQDGLCSVTVHNENGDPVPFDVAKRMLRLVQEQF